MDLELPWNIHSFIYNYFGSTGESTQGLKGDRQELYHLSHGPSSLFLIVHCHHLKLSSSFDCVLSDSPHLNLSVLFTYLTIYHSAGHTKDTKYLLSKLTLL
jgi:hypothetical protein